jgi:hypothetical protein
MPDYPECHLIDAPAVGVDQSWPGKDRRRPGRVQNVNPALIPLLRSAADVPISEDVGQRLRAIDYARRRTLLIRAVASTSTWGCIALCMVMAAVIRLVTGHGSWIAFFGGVILSLCMALISSSQA